MTKNGEKFLEAVKNNEELRGKLEATAKNMSQENQKKVLALLKEKGLDVDKVASEELSVDELDAVAGGKACGCFVYGASTGGSCFFVGATNPSQATHGGPGCWVVGFSS
jgi:hypothetical protein